MKLLHTATTTKVMHPAAPGKLTLTGKRKNSDEPFIERLVAEILC
jgi:hypothetical protein